MNRAARRTHTKALRRESVAYPKQLQKVDTAEANHPSPKFLGAWRSRDYLVQVFAEESPAVVRLSVNRTSTTTSGGWNQNIPWEDLQRLKSECGYAGMDAVEVYPADVDVVNVANMRHLWVLAGPLTFAWRTK